MIVTDRHGNELRVGDRVRCDDSETGGVVSSFGGLGVFVEMDSDHAIIDWANDQVEFIT